MAYATADELAARLTRDGVSSIPSGEVLSGLLEDAKDLIDGWCRRNFDDHPDDTVALDGNGLDEILLPVSPLRSVSAVSVDGTALTAAELAELEVLSHGCLRGYTWLRDARVVVICTWGYATPPEKVKRACLLLASRLHRHKGVREKAAQGLRSQSVEGVSISLDPQDMDRDLGLLLKPYRRRGACA